LKQIVNPPQSATVNKKVKDTKVFKNTATSLIKVEEAIFIPQLITNFGNRPLGIDNSDIEGEHPG
jgi:hypothetical protein